MTDKKRKTDAAWKKANIDTLACRLYKGDAAAFRAYAAEQGKSVNELFRGFVAECLGRPLERRDSRTQPDTALAEREICITEGGRIFDLTPWKEGRPADEFADGVWGPPRSNIAIGELWIARPLTPEEFAHIESAGMPD